MIYFCCFWYLYRIRRWQYLWALWQWQKKTGHKTKYWDAFKCIYAHKM